MLGINDWAVLVAAVVAFVMGGLWYSPLLFGKAWVKLRGMDSAQAAGTPSPSSFEALSSLSCSLGSSSI
jgi:Protein of unknown function (DUF1761)